MLAPASMPMLSWVAMLSCSVSLPSLLLLFESSETGLLSACSGSTSGPLLQLLLLLLSVLSASGRAADFPLRSCFGASPCATRRPGRS